MDKEMTTKHIVRDSSNRIRICPGTIEYHSQTESCDDHDFYLAEYYVCSECDQSWDINTKDFSK